jgi:hypothetical protein
LDLLVELGPCPKEVERELQRYSNSVFWNLSKSNEGLVGAVGIELKAALKTRKLLILLNEKNAKNTGIAQLRYTPGTLSKSPIYA